jgi:hypothetical protein
MRLTRHALPIATALLVGTVLTASPTGAAAPKAEVPAAPEVAAVAEIYPHLAEADPQVSSTRKVFDIGHDCGRGERFKGARGSSTDYVTVADDTTAAEPSVAVLGVGFRSVEDASAYLAHQDWAARHCPVFEEGAGKQTAKKIRFRAGDERAGVSLKISLGRYGKLVMHTLFVRTGSAVVAVVVMSGDKKPSVAKAVQLAQLAADPA